MRSDELYLKYYNEGLGDHKIAKKVNRCPSTIHKWRKRNKLESNEYKRLTEEQIKDIKEMYLTGLNDFGIGEAIGTSHCNIYYWRKINNLPANAPRGWQHTEVDESEIQPEDKPWNDPESLFCDAEFLEQITGKPVRRIENAN